MGWQVRSSIGEMTLFGARCHAEAGSPSHIDRGLARSHSLSRRRLASRSTPTVSCELLHPFTCRIHQGHIERRIGHHEVALADKGVLVLVVGDGLGDLAFQSMHRQVHLGEANGVGVLLLSIENRQPCGLAPLLFNEVAGLDQHSARPADRVEDRAMVRLNHVDDGLDNGRRRKELAVVVRLLDGKLGHEVSKDAAEDIARGLLDEFAVEHAHQVFEDLGIAIWDGEPARDRGGTAEILQYALEQNRPVIRVWGDSFELLNCRRN